MTREKIINEIKPILDELSYPDAVSYLTQNDVKWLNEIIKKLEQEPCDDAVSRKAVHDMLENLPVTVENKWFNWLQKACIRLAELPPVTSIRPKGRWVECNDDISDWYECSECGYGSEGEMQYSREYDVRTNYCPNCGAKMIMR